MNAPVIAVDGLTKRYGDVLAVDEIAFPVARGTTCDYVLIIRAGVTARHKWSPKKTDLFGTLLKYFSNKSVPFGLKILRTFFIICLFSFYKFLFETL